MRVVTYARVSTLSQETEGESLANQNRAFKNATSRHHWKVARHYQEAASAGTVEGRAEFSRMIAELPKTKPYAIVVDTLDRFTRNLREGLNLLEEMKGHGVGLLPLDWHRSQPLDLDNDRDWADVVDEFTAAERERRRISKRIKRSYEGRRERGAVLANRTPFGLRRQGDHFVPGPDAWIVKEAEKRLLKGHGFLAIVNWIRTVSPGQGWHSVGGLMRGLRNKHYVMAELRTPEQQQRITAYLETVRDGFGQRRENEHEFTGVFQCECGEVLFGAVAWRNGTGYPTLRCNSFLKKKDGHNLSFSVTKVAPEWERYIQALSTSDAMIQSWAKHHDSGNDKEQDLQRRLSRVEQQEAALKRRRDNAFDLLGPSAPASVRKQAEKMLSEVERDELALESQRRALLAEIGSVPAKAHRNPEALRTLLQQYAKLYDRAEIRTKNELNRALVHAIGTRPILRRDGHGKGALKLTVVIDWPAVSRRASSSRARART